MTTLTADPRQQLQTPTHPSGGRRILLAVNVAALIAIGTFLRAWQLGSVPGVNGDEAWSGVEALRLVHGQPIDFRTPTGNLINWFLLLPMAALHAVWRPSFELLRVTPLASGLAALAVNYLLCVRAFDRRTAAVSTAVLALMPINIAYSRFAWDASQSLLATLVILYLPLIQCRRAGVPLWPSPLAIAALAIAVIVHPTNVFAAPLLVAGELWVRRDTITGRMQRLPIPAKPPLLAALAIASACVAYAAWQVTAGAIGRLHGPAELPEFVGNYLRLLSGTTVYAFISGADPGTAGAAWSGHVARATDWLFLFVALVAGVGMWRRFKHSPLNAVDVSLVVGWLAMLVGFFVVAGPRAVSPHFERYGICLVAPAALVIARGLSWWLEQPARAVRWAVALLAAAWLWAAGFYLDYFQYFAVTGGTSHATFHTAPVEPKLSALEFVLRHRSPDVPARIVCSQWWNYWPIAYLAFDQPAVEVIDGRAAAGSLLADRTEEIWFIEFADRSSWPVELLALVAGGAVVPRATVFDDAGRAALVVLGPPEKLSQKY